MKMTRERDVAIDFEKGLFLFLIVIGHFWNYPDEIRFLIAPTDLIYVPVFFFLSGYLFNRGKYSFKDFLARKVKTLLLPYLSFFILFTLLDFNLYSNLKSVLYNSAVFLLYGDGPFKAPPLWFVSTLFSSSIFLYIAASIKSRINRGGVFFAYLMVFVLCDYFNVNTPFSIHRALGAAIIMYSGLLLKEISLCNIRKIYIYLLLFICFVLMAWGINENIGVLNRFTKHSFLSIPSSIGSCILVTVVVKKYISKLFFFERPLIWIAQNGIVILSCHFYIVCCASWILKHFKMESMISFVVQLISVFLGVYLIIPILKKCKPALWGI